MRVGVVGTGRVGSVLGAALDRVGHRVVAASAVSADSRERAERLLPLATLLPVPEVIAAADLVLLTVPDDELPGLVRGLTQVGAWRPGQILVHTSGRFGAELLRGAGQTVGLALHPAMTFGGTSVDLERLAGCCFGVTADPQLRLMAEALVWEMGAEPVWVAEVDRPVYHAALTHAANHLVTLVAQSLELLVGTGVEQPTRVLAPLLSAALDGVLRYGDAALTGPVSRGDVGTVVAHLAALDALGRNPITNIPPAPAPVPPAPAAPTPVPPAPAEPAAAPAPVPAAPAPAEPAPAPPAPAPAEPAATYRALARATASRALANKRLTASDAARVLAAVEGAK